MASPGTPDNSSIRTGALSVVRPAGSGAKGSFETFIRISADGSVTAFNGHVDLGTGIRTALGQIVAEELDVSFARVVIVLGDTAHVPNQGHAGHRDARGARAIAPVKVQPVDTTGAGDAFIGSFARYLAGGLSVEAALREATQDPALSVTRHGAQKSYPTEAEFAAFAVRLG